MGRPRVPRDPAPARLVHRHGQGHGRRRRPAAPVQRDRAGGRRSARVHARPARRAARDGEALRRGRRPLFDVQGPERSGRAAGSRQGAVRRRRGRPACPPADVRPWLRCLSQSASRRQPVRPGHLREADFAEPSASDRRHHPSAGFRSPADGPGVSRCRRHGAGRIRSGALRDGRPCGGRPNRRLFTGPDRHGPVHARGRSRRSRCHRQGAGQPRVRRAAGRAGADFRACRGGERKHRTGARGAGGRNFRVVPRPLRRVVQALLGDRRSVEAHRHGGGSSGAHESAQGAAGTRRRRLDDRGSDAARRVPGGTRRHGARPRREEPLRVEGRRREICPRGRRGRQGVWGAGSFQESIGRTAGRGPPV